MAETPHAAPPPAPVAAAVAAPLGPPPAAAPPASAASRRSRWRRALIALLVLGGLVLLAAAGATWLAWRSEAPLAWLLQQVPGLQASGVQGSLHSGRLRIARLDWQLPAGAGRLQADGVEVDGLSVITLPWRGGRGSVHITALRLQRLQYRSGPPPATPTQPPASLRLPLDLRIDQLTVGQLQIDALPLISQLQTALTLGAESGGQHRIDGLSLALDAGSAGQPMPLQMQGQFTLGADAPLPLQATLALQRRSAPAWQATLSAQGPLASLTAEARLSGAAQGGMAAPTLQARATLQPFAAWPLAALALQTQALDLAALSPRLPSTRLAGSATLQSSGLDLPARLNATLDNSLPGAWDQGRLPLQRLQMQASGRLSQTDRLALDHFDLLLGDAAGSAGRIRGQGRWAGDSLALDLQLDGLQPARLHHGAAALLLSGPLQLQASGLPRVAAKGQAPTMPTPTLALALDARLSGRLLDGSGTPVRLRLVGDGSAHHLRLTQAEAQAGPATASATLQAQAEAAGWRWRGQAKLARFDPRPWWRGAAAPAWARGPHRLDARLDLNLLWRSDATLKPGAALAAPTLAIDRLLAALDGDATLVLDNSLLAGLPLSGHLRLHSEGPAVQVEALADLAGNRATLQGTGGGAAAADRWQATLAAPALAALAPLGRLAAELAPGSAALWPRAGGLEGSASASGRWPALQSQGELRATGLDSDQGRLQSASLGWRHGNSTTSPMSVQLQARGLARGSQRLDQLQASISGTLQDHALQLLADSPLRPPAWAESLLGPAGSGSRLQASARGQWTAGSGRSAIAGSRWQLRQLSLSGGAREVPGGGAPWLAAEGLAGTLVLDGAGQPALLQMAPGRLQLPVTALNWRELRWQPDAGAGRLDIDAELEAITVAAHLARLQPDIGWGGDLRVGARINIHSAATLDADLVLERVSGDLSVTDDLGAARKLGLSDLRLALSAHNGLWQFAQGLAGRRIGTIAGAQLLRSTPERRWPAPEAPLQGVLEARVADLGVWGAWVPPGWRLSGALDTTAQFSGTLGAPQLKGTMNGRDLGLRNLLQGVSLSEGQLALRLEGDDAQIDRLSFKGGEGRLDISGGARLGAQPSARLQLVADHFRAIGRIDRRLVASGKAELELDAQRLQLNGSLTLDEGLIDITSGEAPTLDSDVHVRRSAAATAEAAAPASAAAGGTPGNAARPPAAMPTPIRNAAVALGIALGQNLRLRGQGVDTLLRGNLVVSSPGGRPQINGQLRTQDGTFAAYGQRLEITRGEFSFTGAADNPRLDVLAVRPNLDVLVGVAVAGTAHNPRIRLYSEPDMAEFDKLSWLVMGRGPDNLGSTDTALLQRAALALLAGDKPGPTDQLISALGLTDLSLRQSEGDTRDTIISLGRQLSRRWYVGYERGVHATTGTWQFIYRAAQRFTLRAQSGTENAIDLIWTWRW